MTFVAVLALLWQALFAQSIPFPGPGMPAATGESIAFDASADGGLDLSGSGMTWTHTVTGTHPLLWVGVVADTAASDPTCILVTGVTYNSVSMTQVPTNSPVIVPSDRCTYLFYLINPATGSHTVAVSSTSPVLMGASGSYTGAKQSGVPDSSNNGTASAATSLTVATTVVAANSWAVYWNKNTVGAPSAGTGSTQRVSSANGYGLYDSNAGLSAGSHSLQVTGSLSNWGGIVASFAHF